MTKDSVNFKKLCGRMKSPLPAGLDNQAGLGCFKDKEPVEIRVVEEQSARQIRVLIPEAARRVTCSPSGLAASGLSY